MIAVGRVTLRTGAKLHLMVDGRAVCPVVNGRHAIGEGAKPATVDNAPLACKRCRAALHAAALDAEIEANQRAAIGTTINGRAWAAAAAELTAALESSADRLARQRRTDEMRAMFDAIVAAQLTDLVAA